MATELPEYAVRMIHGESFDVTIEAPVAYEPLEAPGGEAPSPLNDGSEFWCAFKRAGALDDTFAVIRFATTNTTPPFMSTGDYLSDVSKLELAMQASAERMRQIPPGVYHGDVMQARPRGGPLGAHTTRLARITLTIEPGTE